MCEAQVRSKVTMLNAEEYLEKAEEFKLVSLIIKSGEELVQNVTAENVDHCADAACRHNIAPLKKACEKFLIPKVYRNDCTVE